MKCNDHACMYEPITMSLIIHNLFAYMHMYTFGDGLMSNKSKTWDTQKEFVKNK